MSTIELIIYYTSMLSSQVGRYIYIESSVITTQKDVQRAARFSAYRSYSQQSLMQQEQRNGEFLFFLRKEAATRESYTHVKILKPSFSEEE